jgi:hypothetical protein
VKVAYAKIGRAIPLAPAKWGEVGGDNEPPILLNKLARRWPEHEFIIVGRNSGEDPSSLSLPSNVINPWTELRGIASRLHKECGSDLELRTTKMFELIQPYLQDLGGMVVWAGQHGTSNQPIPKVGQPDELTKPQESFVNYAGFIIRFINEWRDANPGKAEVWLCADVRNFLKARDLKHPPIGILGQYDFTKMEKHYRWNDPAEPHPDVATWSEPNVWSARHTYHYARLEVTGIPSTTPVNFDPTGRDSFGIVINEARGYVKLSRKDAMRDWVLPCQPAWVHGKWSDESLRALGDIQVSPLPWPDIWAKLATVRSTFTTPSSGSGWATTKPWEAFAVGTVCFFHPDYDDQDNILRDAPPELAAWLRVTTPEELRSRVDHLTRDDATWEWLVRLQRDHFEKAMTENTCIETIGRWAGL